MFRPKYLLIFFLIFSAKSYSQCNNVNLAEIQPQSAAFGSVTGNLMEPWRAFDGGEYASQTRWGAPDQGMTHYVGINLGAAYNICTVYLEMGSLDYATSFKIQGSNDMANWSDLISLTNNTQSAITIDNLPTTGTYQYIRVLFLNRVYTWSYYNVYKFEIYNRVANEPPSVNLTAPLNGASYQQGTGINLSATAMDNNGSISKVEFYQGTNKVGEATTAPYNFVWVGAPIGAYDIEAKAIDNGGAFTWTDPAHITVTAVVSSTGWLLNGNSGINPASQFLGTTDAQPLILKTNNLERIRIDASGYVGIGQPTWLDTDAKLAVNGTIYSRKITVTQSNWADYVFDKRYRLLSLQSVENYIVKNKHLPGVLSKDVISKRGLNVGDSQAMLLKKIEELTLYLIQQNKLIRKLQSEMKTLKGGR